MSEPTAVPTAPAVDPAPAPAAAPAEAQPAITVDAVPDSAAAPAPEPAPLAAPAPEPTAWPSTEAATQPEAEAQAVQVQQPKDTSNSSGGGGAFSRFRKRLSFIGGGNSGASGKSSKKNATSAPAPEAAPEAPAQGQAQAQAQAQALAQGPAATEEETEQAPAVPKKDSSVPKRKPSTTRKAVPPTSLGGAAAAVAAAAPAAASAASTAPAEYLDPTLFDPSARSLQGPKPSLRELYPPIEPYASGTLSVDGGLHSIYWELSGKKGGKPVVFLHGGPGGGTGPDDRRWFDPSVYQVLVFDQRGSGRSTPSASLEKNDTWSLVNDIEQLRVHVAGAPEKWHVFGGSWGSTLSLAYAQTHPERVSALILRGIFTLRRSELLFFYQEGTSHIYPDLFAPYRDHIPAGEERADLIAAYYRRLTSEDEGVRLEAAKRWSQWEDGTCRLYVPAEALAKGDSDKFARIECHFFQHAGFFPSDGYLLSAPQLAKIAHIPTTIVQGRYDVVCPAQSAHDLHEGLKRAGNATHTYVVVPDAGHSAKEPGIRDALVRACDAYRSV
ncbi:hypothetical protein OC844_005340 [Tilletia horrida]|nr:hypothetical protein OC844_005340 [Tilletia horrida]